MNPLLTRILAVAVILAAMAWLVTQARQSGYTVALEITETPTEWAPRGDSSISGTRYYHLKRANPLTAEEQRSLALAHGISFIEYLPRSGYIVKRRESVTENQLTLLDDEDEQALRRIGPTARLAASLKTVRELNDAELNRLGSTNGSTLPVLVSYRQDVPIGTQRLSAEAASRDPATDPVIEQRAPSGMTVWRVVATATKIEELAEQDIVRWIEPSGPRAQTDVGEAVAGVGGVLPNGSSEWVNLGQMEPCAPLTIHKGFGPRVDRDQDPHPRCQPILADLGGFPAADKNKFDDDWPLWLDSNGDMAGDQCVWGGGGAACPDGLPPTTAQWHWIRLDTTGPPDFPRYVHITGEKKLTLEHWRICANDLNEDGCPDLGEGAFVVQPERAESGIQKRLQGFSPVSHATHVAGILVGGGEELSGTFSPKSAGMAPEATLAGYSVGMWGDDARPAYQALFGSNIQVVNNSWGKAHGYLNSDPNFWLARDYDTYASGVDSAGTPNDFGRRILIVGSAGNQGFDAENGVERWSSARLGNSSKNSLPVANLAKPVNGTAPVLNPDSSRGPANDGRLTPLVSAIGGMRNDTLPDGVEDEGQLRSAFPYQYGRMQGTSQAAPLVAAAAGVVAKIQTESCATPMHPAVVRGMIVHTAERIGDADPEGPDFRTGYGLLNANRSVQFAQGNRFQTHRITTGYVEYRLEVDDSSMLEAGDLRVTLTWDDPPWPETVVQGGDGGYLLNDLDLELHGPDGRRYFPWILDPENPSASAVQNSAAWIGPVDDAYRDHRNTVEQVVVRGASNGEWRIRVRSNHPFGARVQPQQFSLVSSIFDSEDCTALDPRVVKDTIWLPSDPFLWCLFWVILAIIIILLIIARLDAYSASPVSNAIAAEVPSQTKRKFWLFVFLLFLVFLALYAWMYGNLLWWLVIGVFILALVILW